MVHSPTTSPTCHSLHKLEKVPSAHDFVGPDKVDSLHNLTFSQAPHLRDLASIPHVHIPI